MRRSAARCASSLRVTRPSFSASMHAAFTAFLDLLAVLAGWCGLRAAAQPGAVSSEPPALPPL
eukprot:9854241-Lingulodinium_polyedra.AAC.1